RRRCDPQPGRADGPPPRGPGAEVPGRSGLRSPLPCGPGCASAALLDAAGSPPGRAEGRLLRGDDADRTVVLEPRRADLVAPLNTVFADRHQDVLLGEPLLAEVPGKGVPRGDQQD